MAARKPCAAFLWTHRGLDRERITNATPLDVALSQSITLKTQYDKAVEAARLAGCEIDKVFLFEETGHLPSFKVFPVLNQAMSWCERNDAPLIIHSFRKHSGRGFSSMTTGQIKFQAQINHRGVHVIWIDPTDRDEALHEHFEERRDIERIRRRDSIALKNRTGGLRRFVEEGGKLGFAADWADKALVQLKGRMKQISLAKERSVRIIEIVSDIKSKKTSATYKHIADLLNAMMEGDRELSPPRGSRWTEFSIRIYMKRHCAGAGHNES